MSDPSLSLQAAVVAALKASSEVTDLVAERVYDRVPPHAIRPYIVYGDDDVDSADFDTCNVGWEITTFLHVWSSDLGQVETKRVGEAIFRALHNVDLVSLDPAYRFILTEHVITRYVRDQMGLMTQAVMEFRSLVDQT